MYKFKVIFVLIFICSSITINATEGETTYKLSDNQKIIGTYSGDINRESSMHLIIYKNKSSKKHGIKPFYITKEGKAIQFDEINFEKQPSIISYHLNGENLVLLVQESLKKKERLNILNINIKTKKTSAVLLEDFENPDLIFRLKDKTLLVTKEDKSLKIKSISNVGEIEDNELKIDSENISYFEDFFESNPEIVNTNEYVKNGSTNDTKAYYYNNSLIFDTSKNGIKTMTVDLEKNKIKFRKIDVDMNKFKDVNTYVQANKLFVYGNNKEDLSIKAFDISTGNKVFESNLLADLSSQIDVESLNIIIKKTSRKAYKITGAVNETVDGNIVINMDYVDTRTYNYNYNWWFHHWFFQQQMMWQQQNIINNLPTINSMHGGFTGSLTNYLTSSVSANVLSEKKEKKPIKIVLNKQFKVIEGGNVATKIKDIDKEKYIDLLAKNKKLKHATMSFTDSTSRYIYYSKNTKTFRVKVSKLTE